MTQPPAYPPGTRLAEYELIRQLGVGGLGAVYEAVHEFTQRRVALKLLHPQLTGSDEARERARKEAIALCRVQHRNVVSVHHAGVLPDGTVFVAMELLQGMPLRHSCETEPAFDPARALHIAVEVADGLGAMHDAGIIHRDIKPENILLDRQGEVKLIDLNIAKVRVEGMNSTLPGRRFGTTAYMAPEECLGEGGSARSDVYALGMVVYEMLAGRYAYATRRGLAGLPDERALIGAHLTRMPVPLHEVIPTLPEYFWELLRPALLKPAEARYADGAAFATALRTLRARYEEDVREGRLPAPPSSAGPAGSRRQHHPPSAPPPPITPPPHPTSRVIVAETAETSAAFVAAQPVSTPAPITMTSPWARTSAPPSPPELPLTRRVEGVLRTRRLLRRCLGAAAIAIPVSGGVTALYLHFRPADDPRPAAVTPAATAPAAAPSEIVPVIFAVPTATPSATAPAPAASSAPRPAPPPPRSKPAQPRTPDYDRPNFSDDDDGLSHRPSPFPAAPTDTARPRPPLSTPQAPPRPF